MARPTFQVTLSPPYATRNSFVDHRQLDLPQLSQAQNAQLERGSVVGTWGPGTAIASPGAANWIFYHPDVGWLTSTHFRNGLRASKLNGFNLSYVTDRINNGSWHAGVYMGSDLYPLGVSAPSAAPTLNTNGTDSGTNDRAYVYTYVNKNHGLDVESNPSPEIVFSKCTGCKMNLVNPGSAEVTHQRIYATAVGTVTGGFYLIAEQAVGTLFTDTTPTAGTVFLDWGPGGYIGNADGTVYDHSPAPLLNCLSNDIHGTASDPLSGNGILFGAVDNYVYWSALGEPQYWPLLNTVTLPYNVLALVTLGAETYAFTEGGIWSFSGASDSAIAVTRTRATEGVWGEGRYSVVPCPDGVLYLSRRGITLFDGVFARVLSEGLLDPYDYLVSIGLWFGAYDNGYYYLSNGTSSWRVYLRDLQNISIVELTGAQAGGPYYKTPSTDTINEGDLQAHYGLYIMSGNDIRPFRPFEGSACSGSTQQDFTLQTGWLTLGYPGRTKRLKRLRVTGEALQIIIEAGSPSSATSASFTHASGTAWYWFPPGVEGERVWMQVVSTAAGAVLEDVTVEGTVLNGA